MNETTPRPVLGSIESSSGQSQNPKARALTELSGSFVALLDPLQEILGHLKTQNIELHKARHRLVVVTVIAVLGILLSAVMIARIHVTVQRLEQTEVRLIALKNALSDSAVLAKQTNQAVEETQKNVDAVRKDSEEKPTLALVPDSNNPRNAKVVVIAPKAAHISKPQPSAASPSSPLPPSAPASSAKPVLELPVRVPSSIQLE